MKFKDLPLALLELIFPRQCLSCNKQLDGGETHAVCDACWESLPLINPPVCPRCGLPFKSPHSLEWSPDHLCQDCSGRRSRFDSARSIGRYEGPLRELILDFKLRGGRAAQRDCTVLVKKHITRLMEGRRLDLALNVPLHRRRLLSREFDQAGVLARTAAQALGIPFAPHLVCRVTNNRSQTKVKFGERAKNVKGVFRVLRAGALEGKSVLLVDDVFTSGATAAECAAVLKKGGAAAVHVFTLARRAG